MSDNPKASPVPVNDSYYRNETDMVDKMINGHEIKKLNESFQRL